MNGDHGNFYLGQFCGGDSSGGGGFFTLKNKDDKKGKI